MSRTRTDLVGKRFGRWLVVDTATPRVDASGYVATSVACRCECGTERLVRVAYLENGRSKSCGCLSADITSKLMMTHGHTSRRNGKHPLYTIWSAMIRRCENSDDPNWPRYGGRGIKVCKRWRYSFANFLSDMGERPQGLTLERRDNNGDYTPTNCIWATYREQRMNQERMKGK